MELLDFAQRWCHPSYPPQQINASSLNLVEVELKITFPKDYKDQIIATGLPSPTLALLSAITDRDFNVPDLSDLHSPTEMIEITRGWQSTGMPTNLLAIGCDNVGNSFCYDINALNGHSVNTAPVLFWDHDFGTTEQIAASFSNWISGYIGSWCEGLSYQDL